MAKKATTIVLFFVVLFLLGSTIYVSIILTSEEGDSPTRARPTKASEIDTTTKQTSDTVTPDVTGAKDQPLAGENTDSDTSLVDQTATEFDENGEPITTDEDLLAYANPTPTGTEASDTEDTTSGSPSPVKQPQSGALSPTASADSDSTTLPETGKGTTVSPTKAPTTVPVTSAPTKPVTPVALPVAGNFSFTVVAAVTAGATIVAALFL